MKEVGDDAKEVHLDRGHLDSSGIVGFKPCGSRGMSQLRSSNADEYEGAELMRSE
jgi:hypothetical protein